jgi:hypothetical protein
MTGVVEAVMRRSGEARRERLKKFLLACLCVRIVTLTLGTQRRCFLVCSVLYGAFDEEWSEAPYEVYKEVSEKAPVCFSVRSVAPENLHFVSKTPTSWWWNPYIVNFT